MRIAVTYQNGAVLHEFDKTVEFKIYDVNKEKVVATMLESICGYGQGVLVGFLQDQCVSTLICGKIGRDARAALTIAGISIYSNVEGNADSAVEDLLAGCLHPCK